MGVASMVRNPWTKWNMIKSKNTYRGMRLSTHWVRDGEHRGCLPSSPISSRYQTKLARPNFSHIRCRDQNNVGLDNCQNPLIATIGAASLLVNCRQSIRTGFYTTSILFGQVLNYVESRDSGKDRLPPSQRCYRCFSRSSGPYKNIPNSAEFR